LYLPCISSISPHRDRKARAAGGRGGAARRVQTPTAARHTTAPRSRHTDR
jgi:hypothetical protein